MLRRREAFVGSKPKFSRWRAKQEYACESTGTECVPHSRFLASIHNDRSTTECGGRDELFGVVLKARGSVLTLNDDLHSHAANATTLNRSFGRTPPLAAPHCMPIGYKLHPV